VIRCSRRNERGEQRSEENDVRATERRTNTHTHTHTHTQREREREKEREKETERQDQQTRQRGTVGDKRAYPAEKEEGNSKGGDTIWKGGVSIALLSDCCMVENMLGWGTRRRITCRRITPYE